MSGRLERRGFLLHARNAGLIGACLSQSGAPSASSASSSPHEATLRLPEITWTKKGRFLSTENAPRWRTQHCGMVCVLPWENDTYRMFLTGKEPGTDFQIGWLDLSRDLEVIRENPDNPVLRAGRVGTFDYRGVCMPLVVRLTDSVLYMYYVGWGPREAGMFQNNGGLAVSRDNGRTWKRWSKASFLPLDDQDPFGTGTVFVMREKVGQWRLWYTSIRPWTTTDGRLQPNYHIRYAESDDGIRWRKPKDNIILDLEGAECCVARPMVIKEDHGYRMWFSRRGHRFPYRIGYAESPDGRHWLRKPIDLERSESGWDSEMIEYAWVLQEDDNYLMFYNGNGFGRSGTGTARGKVKS
jgi:hypothetical protein